MIRKYKCEICGKKHNIFRGLESPEPEIINEIPESERRNRIKNISGFYLVDKNVLLGNGSIEILLEDFEEPVFYWNVWVSMELEQFQKKFEELYNGSTLEFDGILESRIPFYPESKGLKVKLVVLSTSELILGVQIIEKSKLKEDQTKPITKNRVIEIMNHLHHPELYKEVCKFEIPFDDRLKEELKIVEKKYLSKNKNFIINLNSPNSLLFQIVENSMLESSSKNGKGFGFHLSFDQSFEESKTELDSFKGSKISEQFKYYKLDEIPIYQLDLQNQKDKLVTITKKLLIEVYEQEVDFVEIESYEM